MSEFRSVPTEDFSSLFDRIGKQWMLITAAADGQVNSMTASWGCFGILWGKPVAVCFIRPQRHTFGLAERANHLSLSFLDDSHRAALTYMGRHSGADEDKYLATGLGVAASPSGIPYVAQAETVVVCRKLYASRLKKEDFTDLSILGAHYPADDFHQMYVCEIEQVLRRNDA